MLHRLLTAYFFFLIKKSNKKNQGWPHPTAIAATFSCREGKRMQSIKSYEI